MHTYTNLLTSIAKAKGDNDFELMAITSKACDIDESYEFKHLDHKPQYLSFNENEIFSSMRNTLELNEIPAHAEEMLTKEKRLEICARIIRGLAGTRLSGDYLRSNGFRIVIEFNFSGSKFKGLIGR